MTSSVCPDWRRGEAGQFFGSRDSAMQSDIAGQFMQMGANQQAAMAMATETMPVMGGRVDLQTVMMAAMEEQGAFNRGIAGRLGDLESRTQNHDRQRRSSSGRGPGEVGAGRLLGPRARA